MGPESIIVKKTLEALRSKYPKGYWRKIHGSQYQHAGIPDIIGCVRGRFIGLEAKTTSGRLSRIQELEAEAIKEAKGACEVFTCPEEALEIVQKHLNSTRVKGSANLT